MKYKLILGLLLTLWILSINKVEAQDTPFITLGNSTTNGGQNHLGAAAIYTSVSFTSNATFVLKTIQNYFSTDSSSSRIYWAGIFNRSGNETILGQNGGNSSNISTWGIGYNNWTWTSDFPQIIAGQQYFIIATRAGYDVPVGSGYVRWGETLTGGGNSTWGQADNISYLSGSLGVISTLNIKLWGVPDMIAPSITNLSPLNNSYIFSVNSSFTSFILSANSTDTSLAQCWFNSTYNSTMTFVNCNTNIQINLTNTFGKQTIYYYANDSTGNTNYSQTDIYIHKNIFDTEAYETQLKNFTLELWNLTSTPTLAILNYSNINYTGTIANYGNGLYNLTASIDLPLGVTKNNFSWWFNDGTFKQSNTLNQTVGTALFGICNATLTTPYLNITFKNETSFEEQVNASIPSGNIVYWIGTGLKNKTYSFSSVPELENYTFCFTPNNQSIDVQETILYANAYSPQRTYQNTTILNSNLSKQILFLLPNAAGIYVTFQVSTTAGQSLQGASISIYSPTFGNIETKLTDASGTATFFLNPLTTYTISFSKSGYIPQTVSITPTQSSYSVQLVSSTAATTVNNTFRGITYQFLPLDTYLTNQTSYHLNFTVTSSYWVLDNFGFTIENESGSIFGSASSSTNGGTLDLVRNTGLNNTFILKGYWTLLGNTTNVSQAYTIISNAGSDTSLANLRDRIRLYLSTGGLFGLQPFGVNIIVFLVIFVTTGIISYKFGITSPAAVLLVMFVLTMMFDYMHLITYSSRLPDAAASMIVGLITLVFGIKEAAS